MEQPAGLNKAARFGYLRRTTWQQILLRWLKSAGQPMLTGDIYMYICGKQKKTDPFPTFPTSPFHIKAAHTSLY